MTRKIFFCIFVVSTVVLFHSYAGEMRLTTYYPAPYGEYKRMVTKTLGVGDNNVDGKITSADAPDPDANSGDIWINGKVGIGTTSPVNKLDVEGGIAVGTTYSGTSAAPVNGMIIEGNVGIGTMAPSQKLEVAGNVKIGAYTLPHTDGTSGQTLVTDGAGAVTWQEVAGGIVSGSYMGTGPKSSKKITLGFRPRMVWIYPNRYFQIEKTYAMPRRKAFQLFYLGDFVELENDGFRVYGNANNKSWNPYYYAASR